MKRRRVWPIIAAWTLGGVAAGAACGESVRLGAPVGSRPGHGVSLAAPRASVVVRAQTDETKGLFGRGPRSEEEYNAGIVAEGSGGGGSAPGFFTGTRRWFDDLCNGRMFRGEKCDGFWISGEYLHWWIEDGPNPAPLVTTSTAGGAIAAPLGDPSTVVLFGGSDFDYGSFAGARLTAGLTIGSGFAVELSGFGLERRSDGIALASDATGSPLIGRPFIDADTGLEFAGATGPAIPGAVVGSIDIRSSSQLWGLELNGLGYLHRTDCFDLGILLGVRYLDLDEDLRMLEFAEPLPGVVLSFNGVPTGDALIRFDEFGTRNQFIGGQIGARGEWRFGQWYLQGTAKLALGNTRQTVTVQGVSSRFNATGLAESVPGGLFALGTNIGKSTQNEFTVIPEFGLNVGYMVSPHFRVFAGYTFLYWGDVVRPGAQIDRAVNTQLIPTFFGFNPPDLPASPARLHRQTDFWAQGLNLGIEVRY